jgi:Rieske Fe-S protein
VNQELTRRRLLALAAPLGVAAACGVPVAPNPTAEVALSDLANGGRMVVWLGDEPVELRREGDLVRARSLWCTHTGCRVNWQPESSTYRCLCHEASFDAGGRVLSGPPPRPLRDVPVAVRGEVLVVGATQPAAG